MNKEIVQFIKEKEDVILNDWIKEMKESGDERSINIISNEVFANTSKEFIDLIISNIIDSVDTYHEKIEFFTENIIKIGWPLSYLTKGLRTFHRLLFEQMTAERNYTAEQKNKLIIDLDHWIDPMQDQMIDKYSDTWEKTVTLQKIALQELSAPLIPVFERISIMPLVGTIDTERARLIMENLLNGVVKHQSDVVLIDITGVPVVDTMVAHHIIQAADAVRLVGAKCMIVGIRPEIAQTIVNLGISLEHIMTTSTLLKGIERALELTNRKMIKVEGSN